MTSEYCFWGWSAVNKKNPWITAGLKVSFFFLTKSTQLPLVTYKIVHTTTQTVLWHHHLLQKLIHNTEKEDIQQPHLHHLQRIHTEQMPKTERG